MSNIIVNMAKIVDAIQTPTLKLARRSVDTVVEKYTDANKRPLILSNGELVAHTVSPRYPNGELIPDGIDVSAVLTEEDQRELEEAYKQKLEIQKDSRLVLNYIKLTIHNAVILGNDCNDYNPTEEIYYLVRSNLPDVILEDKELVRNAFETEAERKIFMEATQGKLTEEHIKEFRDKTTFPEAIAIFEKYYTLRLLTDIS